MFKAWGECAQPKGADGKIISDVATFSCLPVIWLNAVTALIIFAGLTALVMFIAGGFKLMNSAGDPKKFEAARNNFIYGIIGLGIVLFSYAVIVIISIATNTPCIRTFGFACQ